MRKDNRRPFVRKEDNDQHKINGKITAREVRLVVEGEEPQVMSTYDAIKLAEEQELKSRSLTSWRFLRTPFRRCARSWITASSSTTRSVNKKS
jgi:hypothetical protein